MTTAIEIPVFLSRSRGSWIAPLLTVPKTLKEKRRVRNAEAYRHRAKRLRAKARERWHAKGAKVRAARKVARAQV